MQRLARELNLSESVFVLPAEQGGHARIRIFTPGIEMQFAGHPTLGTAFVLAAPMQLDEIRLETGAGIVPVALERDGPRSSSGGWRSRIPRWEPYAQAEALLARARRRAVRAAGRAVRQRRPARLRGARFGAMWSPRSRPTSLALALLGGARGQLLRGVGTRWKTRMFGLGGLPEDPATGSAAGPLAVHLARHGAHRFGEEIEISQGVEIGRPSKLFAVVDGSADAIERVEVGGSAVTVARGEFRLRET